LALRRAFKEKISIKSFYIHFGKGIVSWVDPSLSNKGMRSVYGNTSRGKRKLSPSPTGRRTRPQPLLTSFGFTVKNVNKERIDPLENSLPN